MVHCTTQSLSIRTLNETCCELAIDPRARPEAVTVVVSGTHATTDQGSAYEMSIDLPRCQPISARTAYLQGVSGDQDFSSPTLRLPANVAIYAP
jgi:hypothetical protein